MAAHVEFPEIGEEIPFETFCLLCCKEHMSNEPCPKLQAMAGWTCQDCGRTCHEEHCPCRFEDSET